MKAYLIAIAILLALILIFGTRMKAPKGPLEMINDAATRLDAACSQACETSATISMLLPENSTIYTTDEAICIRKERSISCARCECEVEPFINYSIPAQKEMNCTLSGTPLRLIC